MRKLFLTTVAVFVLTNSFASAQTPPSTPENFINAINSAEAAYVSSGVLPASWFGSSGLQFAVDAGCPTGACYDAATTTVYYNPNSALAGLSQSSLVAVFAHEIGHSADPLVTDPNADQGDLNVQRQEEMNANAIAAQAIGPQNFMNDYIALGGDGGDEVIDPQHGTSYEQALALQSDFPGVTIPSYLPQVAYINGVSVEVTDTIDPNLPQITEEGALALQTVENLSQEALNGMLPPIPEPTPPGDSAPPSGSTVTNPDGSTTTTYTNAAGETIASTTVFSDGHQVSVAVDSNGSTTTTTVNAAGEVTASTVVYADGSEVVGTFNPDGSSTSTVYDTAGAVVAINSVVMNPDGSTTATNADGAGNVIGSQTTILNPDGSTTVKNFDASGNLTGTETIAMNLGASNEVITSFDGQGDLTDTTTVAYNASGDIASTLDEYADGFTVDTEYNPDGGYVVTTTDPDGDTTIADYSADGTEVSASGDTCGDSDECVCDDNPDVPGCEQANAVASGGSAGEASSGGTSASEAMQPLGPLPNWTGGMAGSIAASGPADSIPSALADTPESGPGVAGGGGEAGSAVRVSANGRAVGEALPGRDGSGQLSSASVAGALNISSPASGVSIPTVFSGPAPTLPANVNTSDDDTIPVPSVSIGGPGTTRCTICAY